MRYWKITIIAALVIPVAIAVSMRSVQQADDSQSSVCTEDHDHASDHEQDDNFGAHDNDISDENHIGHTHTSSDAVDTHDHEHSTNEALTEHDHEQDQDTEALSADHDHEPVVEGVVHMTEEDMVRYGIAI